LIAAASGRAADDKAVLIEAFARMGEVLVFRITQEALRARLGWKTFGAEEARRVKKALSWGD
jgi:hypothetical protein